MVLVKWPQLLFDPRRADTESVTTFPANTSIQHVWSSTVWFYLLLVVVANAGKHLIAKSVLSIFNLPVEEFLLHNVDNVEINICGSRDR